MSQEGTSEHLDKKEESSPRVVERLQSYLKDKKVDTVEAASAALAPVRPGPSVEPPQDLDEDSAILRDVLNYKKAALLKEPDIQQLLKAIAESNRKQ